MSKMFSRRAAMRINSRRQAFLLLILGIASLLAAWLLHYNVYAYPLGVLLFGLGMLIAAMLNPYRLMSAGLLITTLGIAVYLAFKPLIPGNQVLAAYILAIGVGLLGIAFMIRQGYIRGGAITPSLLVLIVGIIEYLLAANLTPANFIPFMLSLWLPGIGLLILGIIYLFLSVRD
jgi:hypothetical protein